MQYEIKNSKRVAPGDQVRFRCKRCAECCRHVEQTVVIEGKDGYELAKHLGISVPEFYEKYTETFILPDTCYPIMALNVYGPVKSCIFLKGNHCTVQSAKPRTCRLYPFWIDVDEDGGFVYNFCAERKHHPNGTLIRVRRWMDKNFTDDDRTALKEDWRCVKEIAPLLQGAKSIGVSPRSVQELIVAFKYLAFDLDEPFLQQQKRNNNILKAELERLVSNQLYNFKEAINE